jgi:hypothetical protein
MNDPVHRPGHYLGKGFEVIDVAECFGFDKDAYLFNVLKYILRAKHKGEEQQDLGKALNYLHRRVTGRWLNEKETPPLYCLATPYSKYRKGLDAAFKDAAALAARLIQYGHQVYSPIAHGHPLAVHGGIDPLDAALWLEQQLPMMKRCDALLVAHLPGFGKSRGIAFEVGVFARAGKPIFDLDPADLSMRRRP